ncbi:MAG: glycoside hydrolase family 65 protein [Solirubrobacteraceae bacterium]
MTVFEPGGRAAAGAHDAGSGPDGWTLVFEGYDPETEGLREALCTLGNGYLATRGAAPEAVAGDVHYPGTYVAGVFNRLGTEMAGRTLEHESMVNLPNWLALTFRIDGSPWFEIDEVALLEHRVELDLRVGVLCRHLRFADAQGRRTAVVQRRLISMATPHLAMLETTFTAENWSGRLEVRSAIDGAVANLGVARYRDLASQHLERFATHVIDEESVSLAAATTQSQITVAVAARTRLQTPGGAAGWTREVTRSDRLIGHVLGGELVQDQPVTVEKVVALHTSRDPAISEPVSAACRTLGRAGRATALRDEHALRWVHLWERLHLSLGPGHERASLILKLHLFHLVQCVSEHTTGLDVGVPARGLHGEAYRGHIFWDELFVFPSLTFKLPELTRALLHYRHRRLPEARQAAREAGRDGAMFPWQSGSDGREENQVLHLNPQTGQWKPDRSHRQRHIGIAIACNVWQYFQATGDTEYLALEGAELLLNIARFWSSMAEYDAARDRYVIRGVMGPDEYHDGYPDRDEGGLDNNAYTNIMAAWVFCRTQEALDRLPEPRRRTLLERLGVDRDELARWDSLSRRLFVPFHADGVISQFEGYDDLEELDWAGYRAKYGDIHRLDRVLDAEGDTPNRYKVSKQADVLMLVFLLSTDELIAQLHRLGYDNVDRDTIAATVDYYTARTSHGSTLSRIAHSWVLARADRRGSWELFGAALESDINDVQRGTTAEGIHLGAMAGTIDLVQRGYLGLDARDDVLWLNPRLPAELETLRTTIQYRDHWGIRIAVAEGRCTLMVPPSHAPPITVGHAGILHRVGPGEMLELELEPPRAG